MRLAAELRALYRMFKPSYLQNIDRALNQAAVLHKEGHTEEAVHLLAKALKENPENKALRHHYGALSVIAESTTRDRSTTVDSRAPLR